MVDPVVVQVRERLGAVVVEVVVMERMLELWVHRDLEVVLIRYRRVSIAEQVVAVLDR